MNHESESSSIQQEDEKGELNGRDDEHDGYVERSVSKEKTNKPEMTSLHWLRDFVRGLTHEISGPLTPLSGHLELMESQGVEEYNPLQKRCLKAMTRSVARLKHLNERVLELARLERGDLEQHPEAITPVLLIDEIREKLKTKLSEKNMNLVFRATGWQEETLIQDRKLLERALILLVENAVEFSSYGSDVTVEMCVRHDEPERVEKQGGQMVSISVLDSGPGVQPEYLEHIFKPFVKLAGARPERGGDGPGLGLPIAVFIARALGGTLEAGPRVSERDAKMGMNFILTIPLAHPSCPGG